MKFRKIAELLFLGLDILNKIAMLFKKISIG